MQLILWPAVITFAITLLRLIGELQGWSKTLFNPAAGGGGALVGISWLPFVLGPYFAWKLARDGKAPASAWRTAGMALVGVLLTAGTFVAVQKLGPSPAGFIVASLVSLAAAFVPFRSWSELGKTLFAYALAARVPVAIIMLIAMFGNWGTHYDVLPPNAPPNLVALGPLGRWFFIGLLPQLTVWVAATLLMGTLFGAVVVALLKPKPSAS